MPHCLTGTPSHSSDRVLVAIRAVEHPDKQSDFLHLWSFDGGVVEDKHRVVVLVGQCIKYGRGLEGQLE